MTTPLTELVQLWDVLLKRGGVNSVSEGRCLVGVEGADSRSASGEELRSGDGVVLLDNTRESVLPLVLLNLCCTPCNGKTGRQILGAAAWDASTSWNARLCNCASRFDCARAALCRCFQWLDAPACNERMVATLALRDRCERSVSGSGLLSQPTEILCFIV